MGKIAQQLLALNSAKHAIRLAINDKGGGPLSKGDPLSAYPDAIAAIPTGGGNQAGNTVLFFDYDGTVVTSYSVEEFMALDAMPENPTHDGLTAQGWNWSLAAAKAYVSKYPGAGLNIGMIYKPTDGKLHLTIILTGNLTFTFSGVAGTVDWGDGTAAEVVADGGLHTYAQVGKYEVTVEGVTSIGAEAFYNCTALQSVTIPEGVTRIGQRAFGGCYSLQSVTIPNGVDIGILTRVFYNCTALKSVTIPVGVTGIGEAFYNCTALQSVTIPEGVTSIGQRAFNNCYSLKSVTIPNGVTNIGTEAFRLCYSLQAVCNAVTPPTLASNVFVSQNPVRIFVPDASLAAYKAATNWASYANIIFPISEKF